MSAHAACCPLPLLGVLTRTCLLPTLLLLLLGGLLLLELLLSPSALAVPPPVLSPPSHAFALPCLPLPPAPHPLQKDRIFTTGEVGWSGVPHIEGQMGKTKDYSALIKKAQVGGHRDTESTGV